MRCVRSLNAAFGVYKMHPIIAAALPRGTRPLLVRDSNQLLEEWAAAYVALSLTDVARLHGNIAGKLGVASTTLEAFLLLRLGGAPLSGTTIRGAPVASPPKSQVVEKGSEKKEAAAPSAFNVKLVAYPAKEKLKIITTLRSLFPAQFSSIGGTKELVEKSPVILWANASKEDADKLCKALKDLGAELSI